MSSLYRCQARVGYRPAKSKKLILFEERQIQELSVKLKWQPNQGSAGADKSTEASAYTAALDQSTCSVTISDPYLTGLAWPALFDAAALYTQSNISDSNNILLPPCEKGQDPTVDKCSNAYVDTEVDNTIDQGGIYPFLLLSLWYDVKGTSFGTDFYFRVNGFSVSHGTKYPSVTIRGVGARSVIFNQSLVNITLEEGADIDKELKTLVEKMGYNASFCSNTNSDPSKKRILPRAARYTGITTDEAIKKVLNSVNGNSLSMPTREYANQISLCSRGEVDQGCSVFYLGKGLYEGYEISGSPEITQLALNSEQGGVENNADPYISEAFKASSYNIGNVTPIKRKKAMEKVKKLPFPFLFKPVPKHIKNAPGTVGVYVWQDIGPVVLNEESSKVSKSGLSLFGIAPNGTTAISFLNGVVDEADEKQGRVKIKTKFSLQICEKEGSEKCFFRPIFQESTGLLSVKVKAKDKVAISQEIGTSTDENPEHVRFYILGHSAAQTTLNSKLVWDWAFPEEEIPKAPSPKITSTPADKIVSPAPKKQLQDWQPTTTAKPKKVLLMAGHFDARNSGAPNEWELNAELVKWAQRNAQAYGVSDFIEVYFSPGEVAASSAQSQYSKTAAATAAGRQVIEIHLDEAQGSSGVIPPRKGGIGQINGTLASSYGAFSKDHRDGLGVPNRGGTILEVGRMDGATTQTFLRGSSAQKEALYKQLMDPVMRSIVSEKTRGAGESGTPPSPSGATSGGSSEVAVGRIGNTGSSRGAHLHAQWEDGRAITEAEVRKYIKFGSSVVVTSPYRSSKRPDHKGIDLAANGDSTGVPLSIQGGAGVVNAQKGCKVGDSGCGAGFGNNVLISTPEGNMILAHLQEDSIPPNIAGLTTSSGGGKTKPTIQGSPVAQGLSMETGFKGVPRTLRIIPGRTVISFVTGYDEWVDSGRSVDIDPGVWIASRFKNWFVTECDYKWRDGDLRVGITGVSAWGNTSIQVPTFENYIKALKKGGDIKISNSYYDYIRSLGGLSWKMDDGKDSTEVLCPQAQALSSSQSSGPDTTSPSSVQGAFPAANYKTGDATKDAIINSLYSAGLKTPNAFAGALGNLQEESGFDPNVHNTPIQGVTCVTDSGVPEKCYGLVQWGGGRKVKALAKCGQTSTLQCQLEFVVQEIKQRGGGLVEGMNSAKSASAAAEIWRNKYEVASGGIAKRQQFAEQIVKQIKP